MKTNFLFLSGALLGACSVAGAAPKIGANVGATLGSKLFAPRAIGKIPAALSRDAKLKALAPLLQGVGQTSKPADLKLVSPITLDPAHAVVGNASVDFNGCDTVSARFGQALLTNSLDSGGGITVEFTPPKPGNYLLDFNLSQAGGAEGKVKLQLSQFGGATQSKSTSVGDGHALFLVDLTGQAAPLFILQSDAVTTFYSVEISLVK